MNKTLFLHSDVADPYALYRERLAESGIHRDEECDCWAVYSYEACRQLLEHPSTLIPPSSGEGLSAYAQQIKGSLVRLQNPPLHADMRASTSRIFGDIGEVDWASLVEELLRGGGLDPGGGFDWVEKVAGRLPALGILAGLGFDSQQRQVIVEHLPRLVKIMQPAATSGWAALVDRAAAAVGRRLEERLPGVAVGVVCGLLIQSYDAGKGVLCNALLHACIRGRQEDWPAFVTEVLRYDSPVHHTRRVAGASLDIGGRRIAGGDKIVLVLAAANRDEAYFRDAARFDIHRTNNSGYLSLGAGPHACMARDLVTGMTAECLAYLFQHWEVRLQEGPLVYEPLLNVRLPVRMHVSLTKRTAV